LFRFLKIRPWYDWTEFHSHITLIEKRNREFAFMRTDVLNLIRQSATLSVARLQAILATCNLRRMKDTMLDGKKVRNLSEVQPSRVLILVACS
jgi:hypothetical protein